MQAILAMTPEIGKTYTVPSGMGGVFTARVLAIYNASQQGDGTPIPERVHMRVVSPRNHDWHNYTFTMSREYFEQTARIS